MTRFASFVAILLLLITAAPVLACLTGSAMTHEERACCHSMHGDCGAMEKMDCCQPRSHADVHPQLAASAPQLAPALILVDWMAPVSSTPSAIPLSLFRSPDEHSPPGLRIARITVLRI